MKKLFTIINIMFFSIFLSACFMEEIDFSIYASDSQVLEIGQVIKLSTNEADLNIDEQVIWSSSNESVAIANDGLVYAIAYGETIITAKLGNYEDSLNITVLPESMKMTITGRQTVNVEETLTLKAEISNVDVNEDLELIWVSENPEIALVVDGIVTGVSHGMTNIYAYSQKYNLESVYTIYVNKLLADKEIVENIIKNISYEIVGEFDLTELNSLLTKTVSEVKEGVVGVSNYSMVSGSLNLKSIGSGVIINKELSENGFTYQVLTNHHVIEDYDNLKIYLGYHSITIDVEAEPIISPSYDLALITFNTDVNLPVLEFAEEYETGDFVLAIGNPREYNYFGTVTFGIVSHDYRKIDNHQESFIQHDAAINPGNSGGPLIDLNGNIIGINTLKFSSLEIDNMVFAIDLMTIKDFLNSINS